MSALGVLEANASLCRIPVTSRSSLLFRYSAGVVASSRPMPEAIKSCKLMKMCIETAVPTCRGVEMRGMAGGELRLEWPIT